MRKVIITFTKPKPTFKPFGSKNKCYLQNLCAKCGKTLSSGETAYRTSRKYLCLTCGNNSEIGA